MHDMFLVDLNCFVMSKQVIKRFVQKKTHKISKKLLKKKSQLRGTYFV